MSKKKLSDDQLRAIAKEHTVRTQPVTYDIGTLLKKIDEKEIKLDPFYQRHYRWDDGKSSRLIESLILNIPIPYIYLSNDIDIDTDDAQNEYYSVIDGQQRLTSIKRYLEDDFPLKGLGIIKDLEGLRFSELPDFLKRRIKDRVINCLRIDSTADPTVKFDVFERLNTGSVQLTAQELRHSTFSGPFCDMLSQLSKEPQFIDLTHFSSKRTGKMYDAEIVLRFFALTGGRYKTYSPLMSNFLNAFMERNQHADQTTLSKYKDQFLTSMNRIREELGDSPFAKWKFNNRSWELASRFNAAVFDAVVIVDDEIASNHLAYDAIARDNLRNLFNEQKFVKVVSGSINDTAALQSRVAAVRKAVEA
ncbi:DUF262 domain-containing protein [Bifidobacterium sp. B4001]|uniref:DUF262 domain-containing protein n=1 Tax=unclassified Bifidobacterium TaxID=2608897 RepID=UPI00226B05D6|nr:MULTISPECIES: DUF262 domain-containing protein [unclassified Bifidobacterium]MCX8673261.1 DUF262 domain-containing protein [Bifidobacterium sp. B4079]MCX8681694.1 DUF262 domain-containing protein [Bifidobacterium sp. B4001]